MKTEYEDLERKVIRKHSFKFNPKYSESFKTEIDDNQIIPLIIEVFNKLEWQIVYQDKKIIEAKTKNNFDKLVGKITIEKKSSGRIEICSKSLEGNFWDVGKNSKRTGLFILLFNQVATEYKENGKLTELQKQYDKKNNWEDYKIPNELPKPNEFVKPNLSLSIIGALTISILTGVLIGFLTIRFIYIIGIYETGIGIILGYLFGQILKKTNYLEYHKLKLIIGGMVLVTFLTSQFSQYLLIINDNNISNLHFFEFIRLRIENGLTIKDLNTGAIGLLISWALQIILPFFICQIKVISITMSYMIEKVPEKVLEYVIYLFEMEKPESEVRALLAQKGWNQINDQDVIFDALGAVSSFQQNNRE